jgi:arylsulfatase B
VRLLALLSCCLLAAAAPPTPPHVIFMLGDEVGWNNVGWHSNITISPHMTGLAKTGLTLNRAYVQVNIFSVDHILRAHRFCLPRVAKFR